MRRSVHHHRPAAGVPAAVGRGGRLRRGVAARVRRRRRRGRGRGHHYRPCGQGRRGQRGSRGQRRRGGRGLDRHHHRPPHARSPTPRIPHRDGDGVLPRVSVWRPLVSTPVSLDHWPLGARVRTSQRPSSASSAVARWCVVLCCPQPPHRHSAARARWAHRAPWVVARERNV